MSVISRIALFHCDKPLPRTSYILPDFIDNDDDLDAYLSSLSPVITGFQKQFNPVVFYKPKINRTVDQGNCLRGRLFQHTLWTQLTWEPVITADELKVTANLDFLKAFWGANCKYLVYHEGNWDRSSNNWSKYIEMITPGGDFPVKYLEDMEQLPEVTLTLNEVEPA